MATFDEIVGDLLKRLGLRKGVEHRFSESPTGRINLLDIDYAELEKRVSQELRFLAMYGGTVIKDAARVEAQGIDFTHVGNEVGFLHIDPERMKDLKKRVVFISSAGELVYVDRPNLKVVAAGVPFTGKLEAGWKVAVVHKRLYFDEVEGFRLLTNREAARKLPTRKAYFYPDNSIKHFGAVNDPLTFGGETVVAIVNPDGFHAAGVATCSPDDQFDRKTGRDLALARAINNLNEVMNS